jgi:hypothetical protein
MIVYIQGFQKIKDNFCMTKMEPLTLTLKNGFEQFVIFRVLGESLRG